MAESLSTNLAGVILRNPVLLAAGTAGTLDEMGDALDLSRIGGIVTKSITRRPREGNPTWRILPTDGGMLNAIGLANVGLDAFLRDYAPKVPNVPTRVIGSIAGFSIDDYVAVAAAMDGVEAIPAVELNVSCPNVHGGAEFGSDAAALSTLVRECRKVLTSTRLFVKLSPIVAGPVRLAEIARSAVEPAGSQPAGPNSRPGAEALCISNTLPAMAIDVESRKPRLANVTGGLSGPALHPVAVKLVHDVYRAFAKDSGTPLVGIGGVIRWEHAAEFILAGASAVEIGTGLFADPRCPIKVAEGLARWAARQRVGNISELVGRLELPEKR
ncbi:dihydroorotate dehydrogenase (NAD+) catalytic subunit [Phycisphaerales bacterium]|nr:dihydroorotate dehydrogenase (NAD+) catalytic subunit [Phycisphaerales bacterium]